MIESSRAVTGGWRRAAGVSLLFVVLTVVMTWPQAVQIGTHGPEHQDVYFNLWRLRWVQHALATAPADLFNGNQFHPERRVLAYSDAMLVEGLVAAPLFAAGVPPLLVHNLLLLGAMAASGIGMFVLARHLTGSSAGGVAAGIVFAFASYRFEHYMHMELQWAVWCPWAFWAQQRTLETGALRYGILTGAFIALQILSSVYYGMFLAVLLPLVGALQLLGTRPRDALSAIKVLAVGAILAASVSWVYSRPYDAAAARVGTRGAEEVRAYSAKARNYLAATDSNLIYGKRRPGAAERRLFPGLLAPVLGLAGLLLIAPPAYAVAYLVGLIAAFDLSLGMNGVVYPLLYDHVGLVRGLRAPARAAIFCLLFLGVLAAHGLAALERSVPARIGRVLSPVALVVLLVEYWVAPLSLVAYHNAPPPLYGWLAGQPRGIVAEFPMPAADRLPGPDPRYVYMSTFHWMPLVNGYSGYYPPSYVARLHRVGGFPDEQALTQLRRDGVSYVIVHSSGYAPEAVQQMERTLNEAGAAKLGDFFDGWAPAAVFRLR